jgi:kynurenine/2-aminoadipate aminotransferase
MDYSRFISKRSNLRKPSAIRALLKYLSIPGMISLGGGNPHPSQFPFETMSIQLKNKHVLNVNAKELETALQYSPTHGIPDFVSWLKKLQTIVHSPPHSDFEICVGAGSQDVLTKAFEMLIDPQDSILIEAPAYSGTLAFLRPLECQFVHVSTDSLGLDPSSLAQILKEWPIKDKPLPKILYTVPIGGNPTGLSTTLERKKEIYKIAEEYDLLILEDDPYYYLQFDECIPSYFSFDASKRVLRFDSFSKILSAGVRIGYVFHLHFKLCYWSKRVD